MPLHPERVYPEFNGWPDFLNFNPRTWLPFDQAREHVRQLKLRNQEEFRDWVMGRLSARGLPPRPNNIPANPDQIYCDQWKGYNDFLGTPKPRNIGRVWRPFKEAREFVRSLKLSSVEKFSAWSKGSLQDKPPFPNDIPSDPYGVYGKEKEWKGMSDFLGSKPSGKYVVMWPFDKSRAFVRKLGLTSSTEYIKWAAGERLKGMPQRPPEIPVVPRLKYPDQWRGWDDWLRRSS